MFNYYGCKNRLSKNYPAPKYELIVEPFAGSAAYSMYWLSQNPALRALLVEKSDRVYDAWMWLKTATEKDLDDLLSQCVLGQKTSNFFIMATQTSNALFNCKQMTVNQRMVAVFPRTVKRMKSLLPIMSRVEIVHEDYANISDREATWFVDPPYQPIGNTVRGNGYDKKCGCTGDFIDYGKPGEWCKSRSGQVIVCEQEGASWLPFRTLCQAGDSQGKRYSEMIWTNEDTHADFCGDLFKWIDSLPGGN